MISNISARIQNYPNLVQIQKEQKTHNHSFAGLTGLNNDTVSFTGKKNDKASILARIARLKERKAKIPHKVVVISGPSGVGKDTIIEGLRKKGYELQTTVSYTTRAHRKNLKSADGTHYDEKDGVHYHFISKEKFEEMDARGEFFEQNKLANGTRYGGTLAEVESMRIGHDVIKNISADAAPKLKKQFGEDAVLIFIKAPSEEEVVRRLIKRGTETAESIAVRLKYNKMQMTYMDQFDKVIVNDNLNIAVKKTLRYLKSRQSKVVRGINLKIEKLLKRL